MVARSHQSRSKVFSDEALAFDDVLLIPAYSDILALRPCDSNVNSSRGNKYFDESDPSSNSYKLIAPPEARLCSSDHNSWSPPESIKGRYCEIPFLYGCKI